MASVQLPTGLAEPAPLDSTVPLSGQTQQTDAKTTVDEPPKTQRVFGLGKKKVDETTQEKQEIPVPAVESSLVDDSTTTTTTTTTASPTRHPHPEPLNLAASPQRSSRAMSAALASPGQRYRSSSPRLHSPASSQIFERNVQDSLLPGGELSPAIPAHIQTEDHIPPVLEASSLAITDDHLNPDEVEIVTHTGHLPAAAVVTGAGVHDSGLNSPVPITTTAAQDEAQSQSFSELEESTYGSLDNTDPRRLSFISFADVVQAEHAENNRDALHLLSLSSTTANRSPSPVRSPASLQGLSASPPLMKGLEVAAAKLAQVITPSSPTTATGTHSPPLSGGELNVETMRQALRKTGSGDLSGFRSQALSAIGTDEVIADKPDLR